MDNQSKSEDLELPKSETEDKKPQVDQQVASLKRIRDAEASKETARVEQKATPVQEAAAEKPKEESKSLLTLVKDKLSKAVSTVTKPISRFAEDTAEDYNFGYDIGLYKPQVKRELREQGQGLSLVSTVGYYIARFEINMAKPFATSRVGRMTYGIGSMVGGAALGLGIFKITDIAVGSAAGAFMAVPALAAAVLVGGIYLMGEVTQSISNKADSDFGVVAKYVKYGTTGAATVALAGGMLLGSPLIAMIGLSAAVVGFLGMGILTSVSTACLAGNHAGDLLDAAELEIQHQEERATGLATAAA